MSDQPATYEAEAVNSWQRVLFFGSRDWDELWLIEATLFGLLMRDKNVQPHDVVVIHGGCRGADRVAGGLAETLGFQVEVYPADWERHGRLAAGHIRNQQMLVEGRPDVGVGFKHGFDPSPDAKGGTEDMARRLKRAGIPYYVIGRPA